MKPTDFERIERFIKGNANDIERKEIEKLFIKGEENLYFRDCLHKDWDLLIDDDSPNIADLNRILDKVHHVIRGDESLKRQNPLRRFVYFYMRAAAILLIPLLIFGGIVYSTITPKFHTSANPDTPVTIFAPAGSRVSFSLPDGTTGKLNSNSSLTYSVPFTKERNVKLEGEAWFEVKHDEKHPFNIKAGNSTIYDLGTKFNLSAYPIEDYVEVVLLEGKIEFDINNSGEKEIILPSERLILEKGKTTKSVVDPSKYNSWINGQLAFREDSMAEVVRRIERWYNVKITLADDEIRKYSFRATFEDDSLEDVLKLLSMTSPNRFTYKIIPPQILSDGTITKKKVIISKNS